MLPLSRSVRFRDFRLLAASEAKERKVIRLSQRPRPTKLNSSHTTICLHQVGWLPDKRRRKTAGTSGINATPFGSSDGEFDVHTSLTQEQTQEKSGKTTEEDKLCSNGDFVIVHVFGASKQAKGTNFVAQILHLVEEGAIVTFLRRLETCFVYPDIEDSAQVMMNDIIFRLPPPNYGKTGRTKHMMSFPMDLTPYRIP